MILNFANIIPYIINQIAEMRFTGNEDSLQFDDLLTTEEVSINEIIDEKNPSKNNCFSVKTTNNKLLFFLKQPKVLNSISKFYLYKETTFYKIVFLNESKNTEILDRKLKALQDFLPYFYTYDPNHAIEIIGFVNNTHNLSDYMVYNKSFPSTDFFENIGKNLRIIHDNLVVFKEIKPQFQIFENLYPLDIFLLDFENLEFQKNIYPELLIYINYFLEPKNKKYIEVVKNAINNWKTTTNKTLIHGDYKLKNILIPYQNNQLKIVDWENSLWGDREWDIANFYFSLILNRASIRNWNDSMTEITANFKSFKEGYGDGVSEDKIVNYFTLRILEYCINNTNETIFRSLLIDLIEI